MTKLQPALFLPIALIAVPLIEIALFVVIGGQIGLLATIAVVVATAVAGTMLLRHQGLAALEKARRSAEAGELPVAARVDAVVLFVAGLLLLTPGFLTDAFGLALFVPPLRGALAGWAWRMLRAAGAVHVHGRPGTGGEGGGARNGMGPVIEGHWREVEETPDGTEGGESPWRG